jgi:bifunctional non-homologous end joining protein LigD
VDAGEGLPSGAARLATDELSLRIGRREVKITHPRKILFPDDGVTKQELVDYYWRAATWMLPHVRGRPVAMERYPDGIDKPGFFQKEASPYFPDWIRAATVKKEGGVVRHVVCDDAATLVYLANQACVTPHVWLSRVDRLTYPDQMVFDLDPSGGSFDMVKSTAESLKVVLDDVGLPSFVKTTGSRGLHVAVPLKRTEQFDTVRDFARELAALVVRQAPRQRTLELLKSKRRGRVFVDTNRNAYAQTMAPAYAVRARRGAPVSFPIDWRELRNGDLRPDGMTIRNVFERLEKVGDLWHDFWRRSVSLKKPRAKFEALDATRSLP